MLFHKSYSESSADFNVGYNGPVDQRGTTFCVLLVKVNCKNVTTSTRNSVKRKRYLLDITFSLNIFKTSGII